ncbi:hypothetical protein pEaSNUABM29_00281 [Erwinia phage pEa_SNUABM_29]|nr:hypothetical protein pEaSNUABM29_00281 [Erwinia phage pEa_SNUABM_29]
MSNNDDWPEGLMPVLFGLLAILSLVKFLA